MAAPGWARRGRRGRPNVSWGKRSDRGGLVAKRGKRRRSGSFASLKAALWATVCYNLDVIEDPECDHELKQRACNSLTQTSLAYTKLVELYDFEREVTALERLAPRNGHHATGASRT